MKTLTVSLLALSTIGAAGCTSTLKLENVAGTWTCDRVDGVCADISRIDQATIGPRLEDIDLHGAGRDSLPQDVFAYSVAAGASSMMPSRTPDEVARIVLAPSLDQQVRYHSSRVMFAVMKSGDWVPGSFSLEAEEEEGAELIADAPEPQTTPLEGAARVAGVNAATESAANAVLISQRQKRFGDPYDQ